MSEKIADRTERTSGRALDMISARVVWIILCGVVLFVALVEQADPQVLGLIFVASAPAFFGIAGSVFKLEAAHEIEMTSWILCASIVSTMTGGPDSPLNILFILPIATAIARARSRLAAEAAMFALIGFAMTSVFVSTQQMQLIDIDDSFAPAGLMGAAFIYILAMVARWNSFRLATAEKMRQRLEQVSESRDELAKRWKLVNQEVAKVEDLIDARSAFFAQTSHEMRTPLNAILGFSEMMKQETFGPLSKRYKEYAELVHEGGRSLQVVVDDVLDLSKIDAGHYQISPILVSLSDLVTEAVHFLEDLALRENVTLKMLDEKKDIEAFADPRAVRQVALNLISNGIKYSPRGGKVLVRVSRVKGGALLSIRDQGIGIDPAVFEDLKKPYAQAGDAMTQRRAPKGTGLGLSVADGFMQLHGGRLFLNDKLEKGSQVMAFFPDSTDQ